MKSSACHLPALAVIHSVGAGTRRRLLDEGGLQSLTETGCKSGASDERGWAFTTRRIVPPFALPYCCQRPAVLPDPCWSPPACLEKEDNRGSKYSN